MHYLRWYKHGDPLRVAFERQVSVDGRCSVDGCEEKSRNRGLCHKHYARLSRRGTVELTRLPIDLRFRGKHHKVGECWEWQAERDRDGYGYFWAERKRHRAHRWAYIRYVGPIPEGLEIDHVCGNRACVRPSHLEPVTNAENLRRARARAAVASPDPS